MSELKVNKVTPRSGTTVTLGDSGDTITIPSGATLDASNATLTLPDGSVTAAKLDSTAVDNTNTNSTVITGQTAETSIDGADSILIYDDSATALRKMTRTNFVAGIGGTNTPAFYAYAAAQSIPNNTDTKINLPSTLLDTNSAVASNKFTVPSGEAGTYFLSAQCGYNSASDWDVHFVKIFKNGSEISKSSNRQEYDTLNNTSIITNLSVGDYIELYVNQGSGSSQDIRTPSSETYLQGFKLIT